MDNRAGNHLTGIIPIRPNEAAFPPGLDVSVTLFGIADDVFPGRDRVLNNCQLLTPHVVQITADIGILHPDRAIGIPGEACPARAAPGFILGEVGSCGRVVRFLCFPGDNAVLDENIPTAGTGTVYAMCRPNDLVMLPAATV
ncbi:hypothetical protein D3C74_361750 [compost metagenome]